MDLKQFLRDVLNRMFNILLLSCCKNNSCMSECCVRDSSVLIEMSSPQTTRRHSV